MAADDLEKILWPDDESAEQNGSAGGQTDANATVTLSVAPASPPPPPPPPADQRGDSENATPVHIDDKQGSAVDGGLPDALFEDIALPSEQKAELPAEISERSTNAENSDKAASLAADELFGDVQVAEGASAVDWQLSIARNSIQMVDTVRQRLSEAHKKQHEGPAATRELDRTLAEAEERLATVSGQIETLSEQEEASDTRVELVDAYFRLQRLVESIRSPGSGESRVVLKRKRSDADKKLVQKVRKTAGKRQLRLSRSAKLVIFFAGLAVVRLAMVFGGDERVLKAKDFKPQKLPGNAGLMIDHPRAPKPEDLNRGVPHVQFIALTQSSDGIHCTVLAQAKGGPKLRYTFTWWENDELYTVEHSGKLSSANLKVGAKYRVEVKVTNRNRATTVATENIVFRGGKGGAKKNKK